MSGVKFAGGHAPQRRAERVVGRGDQRLVFGADLGARAHDAAGKGHDDVGDLAHGGDAASAAASAPSATRAEDQQVAAAHRLGGDAGVVLARRIRRP